MMSCLVPLPLVLYGNLKLDTYSLSRTRHNCFHLVQNSCIYFFPCDMGWVCTLHLVILIMASVVRELPVAKAHSSRPMYLLLYVSI